MDKEKPKIIALRLPRKQYSSEVVDRYISYKGSKYSLSDEKFSSLLERIPAVWNTEKDRLISFSLYDDKSYSCFRKKDAYNFSTKETEEKSYFFDGVTDSEVDELIKILASFYNECLMQDREDVYESIIDSIQNTSYIKERILLLREDILKRSDYMFNRDYTFKSPEEEQKWIEYRQQWRDITQQDFWINNDFSEFSLPVSPRPAAEEFISVADSISEFLSYKSIPNNYLQEIKEFLNSSDYTKLMQNFSSILYKSHVLQTLAELKMPIGGDSASLIAIENVLPKNLSEFVVDFDPESLGDEENTPWQIHLKNIDRKLEIINQQFSAYNLNFTISDIIAKIVEDINKSAEEYEIEKQALNLLEDIAIGESLNE